MEIIEAFEQVSEHKATLTLDITPYGFGQDNGYIRITKHTAMDAGDYYEIDIPHFNLVSTVRTAFIATNGDVLDIPYQFEHGQLERILAMIERCQSYDDFQKTFLFIKNHLYDAARIELEDGLVGQLSWDDSEGSLLRYKVVRKNGELGKLKRNLYGNVSYKIIENNLV